MKIETQTVEPVKLFPIIVSILAPAYFFYLYAEHDWWMIFCCIFAYLSQIIVIANFCTRDIVIDTERPNYKFELSQLAFKEKRSKPVSVLLFLGMMIVDAFPFLAMSESYADFWGIPLYEGGTLVTALVFSWLVFLFIGFCLFLSRNLEKEVEGKIQAKLKEEELAADALRKRMAEESAIRARYGEDAVWVEVQQSRVIFSEQHRCVEIFGKVIPFENILSCLLVDNAEKEYKTVTQGKIINTVPTDTPGGPKDVNMESETQSTTVHDYVLYIGQNSLQEATIAIPVGPDSQKAYYLDHLFDVVLERNKE